MAERTRLSSHRCVGHRNIRCEPRVVQHERDVAGQAVASGQRIQAFEQERGKRLAGDAACARFAHRLIGGLLDPIARQLERLRNRIGHDDPAAKPRSHWHFITRAIASALSIEASTESPESRVKKAGRRSVR